VTTRYLQLAHHHATGVTLTDTVLRFVILTQHAYGVIPERSAELAVPAGCLLNGKIVDKSRFITFLKNTRRAHKIDDINLVLDSAQIQTLTLSIKGAAPLYIKEAIEKEFKLSAKDIVYEYKAVGGKDTTTVMQMTGIAKSVAQEFINAFKSAGMTVLSIESVGHALSRAVLPMVPHQNALVVSIDSQASSLTFVINGRIAQTLHIEWGDDVIMRAIMDTLAVSGTEAQRLKQDQGLIMQPSRAVFDAVVDECAALVKHIDTTYIAWRTAHPALPPLEAVYLTGAGSTLRGLDEYLSVGLRVPVQQGNVWANCLSFDEHIPSLPQAAAVRYAAAIGVTLVAPHMVNLLPHGHKTSLHRKHVARLSGKILLSFILGMAVGFAAAKLIAQPGIHIAILATLHKIQARW
jgi:Tfp pilus assembly PilM family ATPase